jgi:LAO/AO transport system kinase
VAGAPGVGPGAEVGQLLARAQAGDVAALARLLTLAERGGARAREVSEHCFGPAAAVEQVVGLTGPPGTGKSTLVSMLIAAARRAGRKVAVLAVDPSSPRSGGALLGDRVRMQAHAGDSGVFVRSMATRGALGGLAVAVPAAVRVLAAAGWPVVLLETVGVGQSELDVAATADTTVVVLHPGWGDAVQVAKAGLLEVADVLVVNKADRPGASEAARELEAMLDLGWGAEVVAPAAAGPAWRPPVVLASASRGEGVDEVWAAVAAHRHWLRASGSLPGHRAAQAQAEALRRAQALVSSALVEAMASASWLAVAQGLSQGKITPEEAGEWLAARVGRG